MKVENEFSRLARTKRLWRHREQNAQKLPKACINISSSGIWSENLDQLGVAGLKRAGGERMEVKLWTYWGGAASVILLLSDAFPIIAN